MNQDRAYAYLGRVLAALVVVFVALWLTGHAEVSVAINTLV